VKPSYIFSRVCLRVGDYDKEPAASRGVSNPGGQAGFSSALVLATLSNIMYNNYYENDKHKQHGLSAR